MAETAMNLPREGQHMISPRQKHERQRGVCSRGLADAPLQPRDDAFDLQWERSRGAAGTSVELLKGWIVELATPAYNGSLTRYFHSFERPWIVGWLNCWIVELLNRRVSPSFAWSYGGQGGRVWGIWDSVSHCLMEWRNVMSLIAPMIGKDAIISLCPFLAVHPSFLDQKRLERPEKGAKNPNSLGWASFVIVSAPWGHPSLRQRILWVWGQRLFCVFFDSLRNSAWNTAQLCEKSRYDASSPLCGFKNPGFLIWNLFTLPPIVILWNLRPEPRLHSQGQTAREGRLIDNPTVSFCQYSVYSLSWGR